MFRKFLAVALVLGVSASVMAVDKIHVQKQVEPKYQEHVTKKGEAIEGKIEKDSPGGIVIKTKAGKTVTVPPTDVLAVEYDVGKGLVSDFRSPLFKLETARTRIGADKVKALNAELENFRKLHKDIAGFPDARAYVEFKIAEATALLAQDDVTKRNEAIKLLSTFVDNNSRRWTILPALTTLARLQEEAGQTEGALETYKKMAEAVTDEKLKQQSKILVGRLLLRTAKYKDAEDQLGAVLEKLSDDNVQKPLVRAYLAEAKISQGKLTGVEKELDGLIKSTSDSKLRGVAYNLLGDLHSKAGKNEEAFWAFLRVDALYNEDVEEHAKALYHLSELFTRIKKSDPGRADDCARRLRDKRFAASPYQKRLIAEKGDPDKEEPKKDDKKDKDTKKDKQK